MITYQDLFEYLFSQVKEEGCDCTLRHTKRFAQMHGLSFYRLSAILITRSGNCDCKVLFNAVNRLDNEAEIIEHTGPNAQRYAKEKGYYCHCLVDGMPASPAEAYAASNIGKDTEWGVTCDEDAPCAELDTVRAAKERDPDEWEDFLYDREGEPCGDFGM